jgi:hypothetical protein
LPPADRPARYPANTDWWAPGSQSAKSTERGHVSARPTPSVVTPGEPEADVKINRATVDHRAGSRTTASRSEAASIAMVGA